MTNKYQFRWIIYLIILVLGACSPTKYVLEDEYLLDHVKVTIDTKSIKAAELEEYIKQKPNLRILNAIRFHLGLYNMSGRNDSIGINRWLRKIGEAPVIFNKDKEDATVYNLKSYLRSKGYYNADVEVLESQKKDKRINITYNVTANTPYKIQQYNYKIDNPEVRKLVESDSINKEIHVGNLLDAEKHDQERSRITTLLNNNGYYDFTKKDIGFLIDSFNTSYTVIDSLVIDNDISYGAPDSTRNKYLKYTIKSVKIYTDFNSSKALNSINTYFQDLDSLSFGNYKFYFKNHMTVKPQALLNRIFITPNRLYNAKRVERTRNMLSELKIVKYVNIQFKKVAKGELACAIYISQEKTQGYSVDLEGTNSSGNYGGAVAFTYLHKNLFKGGEFFSSKLKLARENQIGTASGVSNIYSDEIGLSNQLTIPKFLLPIWGKTLRKRLRASTVFNIDYNFQKRPDFSRTILSGTYGYKWKMNNVWTHQLNIMDLNYVNMHYTSPEFQTLIDSSYLYYSYRDHMIAASNYILTYNNQNLKGFKNSRYIKLGVESAGNMLSTVSSLSGNQKVDGSYTLGNIPFSQYVKFDAEYVFNKYIDNKNNIVYRLVGGIGIPYGNIAVMPFERRYFAGGANSLRGWQVRSLGPGSYVQKSNYFNQTGDIRLEANAEYRFKLIEIIEGALFVDAGNIWTIRDYEEQSGGLFQFDQFYKQIALDMGTGIRLNLNFVVLRFDLGAKFFDPSLTGPEQWRWIDGLSFKQDCTFHFAIGYPF